MIVDLQSRTSEKTNSLRSLTHLSVVCVPQDGLLSAGYTDFINRIHNQIPQVTSDGKRLQVALKMNCVSDNNHFSLSSCGASTYEVQMELNSGSQSGRPQWVCDHLSSLRLSNFPMSIKIIHLLDNLFKWSKYKHI